MSHYRRQNTKPTANQSSAQKNELREVPATKSHTKNLMHQSGSLCQALSQPESYKMFMKVTHIKCKNV